MSVLIKGAKMPPTCRDCCVMCFNYDKETWRYERHKDCPLVEVPTPHERLIDTKQTDVLDKIRADIQELRNCSCSCSDGIIDDVEDIIDKYRDVLNVIESEDKK